MRTQNTENKKKIACARGYIRERRRGVYNICISLGKDLKTGKYLQSWVTFKGSEREAKQKLTELLGQADMGKLIPSGKIHLNEYLTRWLEDYAWLNLRPRTAEGYEHICSHYIIPSLGSVTLNGLKPDHLQRYYREKQSDGLSATTVRHHHMLLHKALQTAVEWGLLARNTADAVKPPRARDIEEQTWDEGDMYTFLEAAKQTPYFALFHTALFTGMRRSELLALRWSDLDLLGLQASVSRGLHVLKGGKVVISPPKSKKGKRTIALSPLSGSVLREYRENQKLNRAMLGKSLTDDDLVFSDSDGNPLLPNTVTHAWIKLVRRTGLKGIRLHDARHTHASLMLKQGIHPKIVQERLGHSSIQITLDTYSHVAEGLQEAAAERFDLAYIDGYNGHKKEDSEKIIDKLLTNPDYVNCLEEN